MGRRRQVGYGTSTSSQVCAVPVWNRPIDRRKLAQAVLALVLLESERTSGAESTRTHKDRAAGVATPPPGDCPLGLEDSRLDEVQDA